MSLVSNLAGRVINSSQSMSMSMSIDNFRATKGGAPRVDFSTGKSVRHAKRNVGQWV